MVNSTNGSEVNDGSNLNTETPSYSSAAVGPDLGIYVEQGVQVSPALRDVSVNATLPAPLELIGSNSDSTITNVSISPEGAQYILVSESPAYVWPTATTGHISVSTVGTVDSALTDELVAYAYSLRTHHSVGVSPIPEIIRLPDSPYVGTDVLIEEMIEEGRISRSAQWMVDCLRDKPLVLVNGKEMILVRLNRNYLN